MRLRILNHIALPTTNTFTFASIQVEVRFEANTFHAAERYRKHFFRNN